MLNNAHAALLVENAIRENAASIAFSKSNHTSVKPDDYLLEARTEILVSTIRLLRPFWQSGQFGGKLIHMLASSRSFHDCFGPYIELWLRRESMGSEHWQSAKNLDAFLQNCREIVNQIGEIALKRTNRYDDFSTTKEHFSVFLEAAEDGRQFLQTRLQELLALTMHFHADLADQARCNAALNQAIGPKAVREYFTLKKEDALIQAEYALFDCIQYPFINYEEKTGEVYCSLLDPQERHSYTPVIWGLMHFMQGENPPADWDDFRERWDNHFAQPAS